MDLQGQYWVGEGAYRYVSIKEFADAFEKSQNARARTEELQTPFDQSKTAKKDPLIYDKYALHGERHSTLHAAVPQPCLWHIRRRHLQWTTT